MKKCDVLKQKAKEIGLEEFLDIIIDHLRDYLPPKYQNMVVDRCVCDKVNTTKTGFTLCPASDDESNMDGLAFYPAYYVDGVFYRYREEIIEHLLIHIARDYVYQMETTPQVNVDRLLDVSEIKRNVICQLVNAAANERMLGQVPHRKFHEFAIIYRVLLTDAGDMTAVITHDMLKRIGLSEAQLYIYAMENTRNLVVIQPLSDTIKEMTGDSQSVQQSSLFFIGNKIRLHGASSILAVDKVHELANILGSDLYIIPSSIHEMLALPVGDISVAYIADMIMEVNETQVDPEERLSNSVYMYSRANREISIALEVTDSILAA